MPYQSDIEKANRIQEAVDFPEVVLIDNFNGCNLSCSMCDHKNISNYRKIQFMPMDLYKKIIDEVAAENPSARVWEIFFGDPFLIKNFAERVRYAKDKGLKDVVTNTNGVMMTPEKSEAVIRAGLDAIYVGVDSASKEIYDKIRIRGDYDKAVSNVLAYRDLLLRYGKPEQKLYVQFVLSDINEHEVENFKRFWTSEGVKVKIRPKISWAGLIEAKNLQKNEQVGRKPCYWLMKTMSVCADGEAALCAVDLHCRVKCGNVKTSSIRQVWHELLREYRKMHLEDRFDELPEVCRNCQDWQSAYAEYFE